MVAPFETLRLLDELPKLGFVGQQLEWSLGW